MKKLIVAATAASLVAGCAQQAADVQPTYVSAMKYERYSCRQIEEEARTIASRTGQLTGVQDERARNDAALTAAAVILFWPAAFFIKGDKQNAAELGRLRGELEALERASDAKHCGLVFRAQTADDGADA
jgi:hypothetical protein